MKTNSIFQVNSLFLDFYNIDYNAKAVNKSLQAFYCPAEADVNEFIGCLIESGNAIQLSYFKNELSQQALLQLLKESHYPVLVFTDLHEGQGLQPVVIRKKKKKYIADLVSAGDVKEKEINNLNDFIPKLIGAAEDKIIVVTCFPNSSMYSDTDEKNEYKLSKRFGALSRFMKILISEKREIGYIYIYAIIYGLISLSLPLGIQSIIGFISSGQITTSVIVLIIFIILGMLITGCMQIMQQYLVEHIKRRLFTKTAFDFAFRIPKIKVESLMQYYPPELMNRFFDIVSLQKGMAKILIDFPSAMLQMLFGLILLSFYHPSFILFGLFLVFVLFVIIRVTGPKGLKTSLYSSKYKYQVAHWLEEMARLLSTFKLSGSSNFAMDKTDYYVSGYLHARKHHFRILMTQYFSFVAFKTIITGGLLILGCILVVNQAINIGQFVAAEIVIILIMNAVEKVIMKLDTVYDTLTSIEKISTVTDLPIEVPGGIKVTHLPKAANGFSLQVKGLKYKFPDARDYTLKGIDLEINAGERVCISGPNGAGKTTLINIILGLLSSYDGVISVNEISMRDLNRNNLLKHIGDNLSQEELFEGTIIENISLGKDHISTEDILWAIDVAGLKDYLNALPDGLHTKVLGGKMRVPGFIARKIILARSIASKPRLLILDDFLLGIERKEKIRVLEKLTGAEFSWTMLIISTDPDVMKMCDRIIVIDKGIITCQGNFETVIADKSCAGLVYKY